MPDPDIAGFAAAQQRLRDKLGLDIRFYIPVSEEYDPSVPLDPQTGKPYDPRIQPLASGFASATVRCTVVRTVVGRSPDTLTDETAIGAMNTEDVALIMAAEDWPLVSEATEFELFGIRYSIEDDRLDGIGGAQRRVVIGEPR